MQNIPLLAEMNSRWVGKLTGQVEKGIYVITDS